MKIFLAGSGWNRHCWENRDFFDFNRLESFVYIKGEEKNISKYNMFLLDSGAFTYMNKSGSNLNWDNYIVEYANFINPLGVAVSLKAQHLCMAMRGVKKHDTWTTTNKLLGVFKEDNKARNEFLMHLK